MYIGTQHTFVCLYIYIGLISATEKLSGEFHKREVLLIAITLLVVKTENIYRNTSKMLITTVFFTRSSVLATRRTSLS